MRKDDTTTNKLEQFKYIPISPRDFSWGLAVSTAGFQHIPPSGEYPLSIHPDGYKFSIDGRRTLNEYQLIYITRGSGYFESASCSRTKIEAGMIFMLFPGEWHKYSPDPSTGWDEMWVGFNGSIMDDKIKNGFFTFKNCVFRIGFNEQTLNTYLEIINVVCNEKKGCQQLASGLVYSLLGRVYYEDLNHSVADSFMTGIINQAKAIMKKDLGCTISLEEIAESLDISYSLFRREFKRSCGVSPGQYRQELKLKKAKELLYSTNMSVAQISEKLRFDCQGQFSTFFRKKTGLPPLEYRKQAALPNNEEDSQNTF